MRHPRFLLSVLAGSLLVVSSSIRADEICGRVVRVSDGDTIVVLDASNTQHKVRLSKIDAPEKAQPFGNVSRLHLAGMITNGPVRVSFSSRDKYGRILGVVFAGEVECNLRMVSDGYAWHYSYFDKSPEYAKAEIDARREKRVLWKEAAQAVPPWEWRKARKGRGKK
jgi:endonuclease YncB( thermonuclease family)